MMYRILLGIDGIAAAIVVYFFVIGLEDGSVSDFNIGIWTGLLLATAAVFAGAWALNRKGQTVLANCVLAVPAVPTVLFGVFMLVVILSGESWN